MNAFKTPRRARRRPAPGSAEAFMLRANDTAGRGPMALYTDWIMPIIFGVSGLLLLALLTRGLHLSQIWAERMAL